MYMESYLYIYTCTHVYVQSNYTKSMYSCTTYSNIVSINIYIYIHIYTYIHIYIYTYIHIYIYTYIHIYIYTYITYTINLSLSLRYYENISDIIIPSFNLLLFPLSGPLESFHGSKRPWNHLAFFLVCGLGCR